MEIIKVELKKLKLEIVKIYWRHCGCSAIENGISFSISCKRDFWDNLVET